MTAWDPTTRQEQETDTLWLYDPDDEPNWSYLDGGLIDTTNGQTPSTSTLTNPWRNDGTYASEAGKFRNCVRKQSGSTVWWMPGQHIPSSSYTIEFWVKANSWGSYGINDYLVIGSPATGIASSFVAFGRDNLGRLGCKIRGDLINPSNLDQIMCDAQQTVDNTWIGFALTYDGTTCVLYRTVGTTTTTIGSAAVPPGIRTASDRREGLLLHVGDNVVISDVRISRINRTPGQTTTSSANSATVTETTSGTVNENLLGGVHFYSAQPANVGNQDWETIAVGYQRIGRTDKFLSAVPIKAGATNATYPTAGQSGLYAYDWRPLDHTLDYYARLGLRPYIGLESTPQILGGSVAPFTGSDLTNVNRLVGHSAFAPQVPNDLDSFQTIVSDLAHYVINVRGDDVAAWAYGNEPSSTSFWSGTQTQFFQTYERAVNAVRSIDPDAYVGGLDEGIISWVTAMITYCGANDVPLDFVSWHHYSGDIGYLKYITAKMSSDASAAGIQTPDLAVGEWGWQHANRNSTGEIPWRLSNWWLTTWMSSFSALWLMHAQDYGISMATFHQNGNVEGDETDEAFGSWASTHRWALHNVWEMWDSIAGHNILAVTNHDVENGVHVQATRAPDNAVHLLVSNHKWRRHRTTSIQITLPSSVSSGRVTSHQIIDSDHSSRLDEGSGSGLLQQVTGRTTLTDSVLSLTMQPRSVHLLRVERKKRRRKMFSCFATSKTDGWRW